MLMFDAFKKSLKNAHPDVFDRLDLKQTESQIQNWLMWDKVAISTASEKYTLDGSHYIVLASRSAQVHTLWMEPTPQIHEWLTATKRVHDKAPPYVFGMMAVHTPGTQAFLAMDTGWFAPKEFNRLRNRYSIFSLSKGGISDKRMKTAQKITSLALQLRLICSEAVSIGYPIERSGNNHFLRSLFTDGASALDKLL